MNIFMNHISLSIYLLGIVNLAMGLSLAKKNMKGSFHLSRRAALRYDFVNKISPKSLSHLYHIRKWLPLAALGEIIRNNRNQKRDREIFEAITFLRNMASIGKGRATSTDYILQMLTEQPGILRPAYIKMLSLLRLNRRDEAANYFYEQVQTPISKDFSRLLIQWDDIDPVELTETLLSYEKSIKEIRITNQKRRDEIVSDLIYFPVVLNVLLIFINFIYVAYFIQQKEMLQMFI